MPSTQSSDGNGPLRPLLSIAEIAEVLGVEVRHVRRLVHERRIPFIKWGHLLRFDPLEIQAWIDGFRQHPGRPRIDA
jgi:excisionase family DNA binding protein